MCFIANSRLQYELREAEEMHSSQTLEIHETNQSRRDEVLRLSKRASSLRKQVDLCDDDLLLCADDVPATPTGPSPLELAEFRLRVARQREEMAVEKQQLHHALAEVATIRARLSLLRDLHELENSEVHRVTPQETATGETDAC